MPLFTRIKEDEVLDHFVRGQVYDRIVVKPGINFTDLRNELGLKNGMLTYHLSVLERQGFVRSVTDGYLKRFYPLQVKVPKDEGVKFSELQARIMDIVRGSPGISQKGIAERLDQRHSVVNYNIKRLKTAGVLEVVHSERVAKCYVSRNYERPPG